MKLSGAVVDSLRVVDSEQDSVGKSSHFIVGEMEVEVGGAYTVT